MHRVRLVDGNDTHIFTTEVLSYPELIKYKGIYYLATTITWYDDLGTAKVYKACFVLEINKQ